MSRAANARVAKLVRTKKPAKRAKSTVPPPPAGTPSLAHVATLLEGGAIGPALEALLAVWAIGRSTQIAALVEQLGEHAARGLPPIEAPTKQLDAAWRAVADLERAADVPRLIAAFEHATAKVLKGWIERLSMRTIDPRIGNAAIHAVPRFVSSGAGPTRTVAFKLAAQMGERETCAAALEDAIQKTRSAWNADDLRDRLEKLASQLPVGEPLTSADAKLAKALRKTIEALANGPAPTDAALASAAAAPSGETTDELLEAVYADPESDAPRLVYADHLQELGDPRGELIALQLVAKRTTAQNKRIAELQKDKKQVARWLGPLSAIAQDPVFERGFLSRCTFELVTPAHRALLSHPALATIEELRCTDGSVLQQATLRSLRRLAGADVASLAALVDRRRLPTAVTALVDLSFGTLDRRGTNNRSDWDRLVTVGPFTSVRELGLEIASVDEADTDLAWLLRSPLGQQLESLTYTNRYDDAPVAPWLDAMANAPVLSKIVFRVHRNPVVVERHGDTNVVVLEIAEGEHTYAYDGIFAGFPRPDAPALQLRFTCKPKHVARARQHTLDQVARYFDRIVDA